MNSDSKDNFIDSNTGSLSSCWVNYDDFNIEDDQDQLWFDTWEGQIELSSQNLSPKKHQSAINDLFLEDEAVDQFDEYSDLPTFEQKHSSSSALLRQTSLPAAIFSSKFDNNFHSAHTLFWNHHHDSSSEDVSQN